MTDHTAWGWTWRFAAAILLDAADFLNPVAWIPGFGILMDAALTVAGFLLWDSWGLVSSLEILNPIEPIDAFIPSVTISGLFKLWHEKR